MIGVLEGGKENKWMFMIMIHNRFFFIIIFLNSKFILKDLLEELIKRLFQMFTIVWIIN